MNLLYYGDNLKILREEIAEKSIDTIYLDPPFNSKATYNMLFKELNGTPSAAQAHAFEDNWIWDINSKATYEELVANGSGKLPELMEAFHSFLGENAMLAYLTMMAVRLVEMQRVLKDSGCLWLHCDPVASHYLKLVLDAIFGPANFRNEIIWRRYKRPKGSQHDARKFGSSTDTILFYSKSNDFNFYPDSLRVAISEEEFQKRYTHTDEKGSYYSGPLLRSSSMGLRPNLVYEYKGFTPGPEGWRMTKEKIEELDDQGDLFWTKTGIPRRKVRPQEEAVSFVDNLWTDIEALGSQAAERLGYPTQKPEALLKRIIEATCPEDGVVLDPFVGCGTAVIAAERMGRQWMGIDITYLSVVVMRRRLEDTFGSKLHPYQVKGNPTDAAGAKALAEESEHDGRYQFQWWAVDLVGGHPLGGEKKKGSDKGIDGIIRFFDDDSGKAKKIIISVKSGKVGSKDVRDLNGTVKREKAQIGCLITLSPPTKPMKDEAVEEGFYQAVAPDGVTWFDPVPKIQILSVDGLLNGTERLQYSRMHESTFQKAELHKEEVEEGGLF
jgi:site-specific DNA-methyltransferase (adenine-specific)